MVSSRSRSSLGVALAFIAVVAFVAFAWWTWGPTRGDDPPAAPVIPPKCIVLITIDTLRADVLGAYGATRVKTPEIDRLAAESTLFERAYAPTPWTKPSIATLLTGLAPAVHGLTAGFRSNERLPPTVNLLAERMHAAGYETGALGYNVHVAVTDDFRRGFRDFLVLPHEYRPFPKELTDGVRMGDPTDAIAGLADRWMELRGDRPFFLWTHFYDPHVPYQPPEQFWTESQRAWPDPKLDYVPDGKPADGPQWQPAEDLRRQLRDLYESEVQYVDHAVGRIVRSLKRLGLYDDTLIVFTSDHGEEFWDHGGFEHGHALYDELLRVPLIVRAPRTAPRRVAERVAIDSLFATVLDACGTPEPRDDAIGPSLWRTVIDGATPPVRAALHAGFTLYWEPQRAVRFGRY